MGGMTTVENSVWDMDITDISADEVNDSSWNLRAPECQGSFAGCVKPDEALAVCLNDRGRVDMDYISALTGLSIPEAAECLSGEVFQDPGIYDRDHSLASGWMLREQYLSGNLMAKLETAKQMDTRYHRFGANIAALQMAMPEKPEFDSVGIYLGAQWIPPDVYSEFCGEILKLYKRPEISHSGKLHVWKVVPPPGAKHLLTNTVVFGTSRMTALKIIEHSLNGRIVKAYDSVVRPERSSGYAYVLNREETLAAQEKQNHLETEFQAWVRKDKARVRRLEKIYYETYTCNVPGKYDGTFLSLPDLNPAVELYKHQRDAVARIILTRNVLLSHSVGSGKTYEIIVGLHELKRMGLSGKNLAVVPNNVLHAFEAAHRLLYPDDNILVVCPKDFSPAKRGNVLEKIRTGDYTAVYMAFSSFAQVHLGREFRIHEMRGKIQSARAAAAGASDVWEKKSLEWEAQKLTRKLEKKWSMTCLRIYTVRLIPLGFLPWRWMNHITLKISP